MPAYSFSVTPGAILPQDNGYLLLSALSKVFPFLHGRPDLQIAPLRGTRLKDNSRVRTDSHSILHIRGLTPEEANLISCSWITVGGNFLGFGSATDVPIVPSDYLASRLVIFRNLVQEKEFQEELGRLLPGIFAATGRRRTLRIAKEGCKPVVLMGYSVHLMGLADETSLQVQHEGLGKYTSMGCGVFHKKARTPEE